MLAFSSTLQEMPTHRYSRKKNYEVEDSEGRIDYWCIYRNYTFVIEMKHGIDTYKQNDKRTKVRKTVSDEWRTMNKQLNSLEDEVLGYQEKTKGVIRLGLHFITSRTHMRPTKDIINGFRSKENIKKTMTRFSKIGLSFKNSVPDLAICWNIPKSILEEYDERNEHEGYTYPGFWVIAKILNPDTHEGANS